MAQNFFIPSKLVVGFQKRADTFTGKLSYVIYYDEKGKLRKETSWLSWIDDSIETLEIENTPTTGFVFNKGIQRSSEWFGSGRSVFRVYSPHDFEFEINSDNLINLLMHSDVSKREILEECVFAWAGTELVLLPTNSSDYQAAIAYTKRQDTKVSAKELVKGRQYTKRKNSNEVYTYIGFFDWWEMVGVNGKYQWSGNGSKHVNKGKKHIFQYKTTNGDNFTPLSVSTLSSELSDEVVENYAELVDSFYSTIHSQRITGIVIQELDKQKHRESQSRYDNRDYKSFPTFYILENDQLVQIQSFTVYAHSKNITFDRFPINKRAFNVSYDPDVSIILSMHSYAETTTKSTWYGYSSSSHSNFTHSVSTQQTLLPAIQQILPTLDLNDIANSLTPDQYVDSMTTLGYGTPFYVLESGKLVEFAR